VGLAMLAKAALAVPAATPAAEKLKKGRKGKALKWKLQINNGI